MGKLYNIIHADEIAKERDKYKTYTGGLGIAFIGTVVAAGVNSFRRGKEIKKLNEAVAALQSSATVTSEKLIETERELNELKSKNATTPAPTAEEVKAAVKATVKTVEDFTETASAIVDEIIADVTVPEPKSEPEKPVEPELEEVEKEELPEAIQEKIDEATQLIDVNVDTTILDQAEKKAAEKAKSNNNKKKGGK